VCFPAGATKSGGACTKQSDCVPGDECIDGACLPFCGAASDCQSATYDRGCVALVSGGAPIGGSVCAFACFADTHGSCPVPAAKSPSCEAPPSPVPYCSQPERIGCLPFNDVGCASPGFCPTLPSGLACAVSNPDCFCPQGKVCTVTKGSPPACTTPGALAEGAACTIATSCDAGLLCAGNKCRRVCQVTAQCPAGQSCQDVTDSGNSVPFARVCL
jgi:hypothetical protein